MVAYLKLKTDNQELYKSDYINQLKEKTGIFLKIQYKICYLYYKLVVWLKYYANIITVKEIYGGYLFIFPFDIIHNRKMKSCMKKTKKLIKRYNINTVILTENLKNCKECKYEMKQINILDGKGIIQYLIKEIVEYIIKLQNENIETQDLYICVNEDKPNYIDNIMYLMYHFRSINIVTKNVNTYQKIANKIAEKENIIITVTNNKKKSLRKAKIIINFDFENSEMQKYIIYRKAILISIKEQEPYEKLGFDGIQIRKIEIDTSEEVKELFKKYNLINKCSLATLYEGIINEKQEFLEVKEKMKKNSIRVIKLYGKSGEISQKECIYLKDL